jgi:hypothetical protein
MAPSFGEHRYQAARRAEAADPCGHSRPRRAGEKMAEKTTSNLQFIGELLLLPVNGEAKKVYEAVQREEKFTLRLRDNRRLQIFLLADSPELGVYEVMAAGF